MGTCFTVHMLVYALCMCDCVHVSVSVPVVSLTFMTLRCSDVSGRRLAAVSAGSATGRRGRVVGDTGGRGIVSSKDGLTVRSGGRGWWHACAY